MSPKGLDTFRVLGENRVAYLDLTGSGVETIAHLRDEWAERKGADGLVAYRAQKNATSIDGLPGLPGVAEVAP